MKHILSPAAFESLESRTLLSHAAPARPIVTPTPTPTYTLTDLGTLGGTATGNTVALAINDAGQVVGFSTDAQSHQRAFYWTAATGVVDISGNSGMLFNGDTQAAAIDARGDVAGTLTQTSASSSTSQAVTFSLAGAAPTTLSGLVSGGSSAASGINDAGVVVGTAALGDGTAHAVQFSPPPAPSRLPTAIDLGTLGGSTSTATAINDSGLIVGGADTGTGLRHAFLYTPTTQTAPPTPPTVQPMQDLGSLGGASLAQAINKTALVVGYSFDANGLQTATLWQNGVIQSLGTLGGASSEASGVNDLGVIVGTSTTSSGDNADHGFLYQSGQMTDLNSAVSFPGRLRPLVVTNANAINNRGQIVGVGTDGTVEHAILLTPTTGSGTDTNRPTAFLRSAPPLRHGGGRYYQFTIKYSDNVGIKASSLGNGNVVVTHGRHFSRAATLVSVDRAGDGTPRSAVYQVRAPGAGWDASDDGLYSINLVANQVSDTSGNFARSAVVGAFTVRIPATPAVVTSWLPLAPLPAPTALSAGTPAQTLFDDD